jgi:hypothetical protein
MAWLLWSLIMSDRGLFWNSEWGSAPLAVVGVWPIPMLAYAVPAAAQEMYRVAYERAVAAARPSLYELACAVSVN